jgi:hypothetical protein
MPLRNQNLNQERKILEKQLLAMSFKNNLNTSFRKKETNLNLTSNFATRSHFGIT